MASPNYGYPYDDSSTHKRPRGLVDPYEIPDSPPPPPKRQRQPLPAKRAKAYGRKQAIPVVQTVHQAINAPSRLAEGYAYAHGNTWGAKEEKLILKSNGIEDLDGSTVLAPANIFRDLNVWNAAPPERPTALDRSDGIVERSFNAVVVNNSQDRTLKIRDLLHDEPSEFANGFGNNGLRPGTTSSGMMPWVAPVAHMAAPVVNMMPMSPGNGQSSPTTSLAYSSPYAMPTWEEQRQMDMAQARTALASIARVSTTPSSRVTVTTNHAAQTAPAAPAPYPTAFTPAAPAFLTAQLIDPSSAAPAAPTTIARTLIASSSALPAPKTLNQVATAVPESQRPWCQITDNVVLETPASLTTTLTHLAPAPNAPPLVVPAAPAVRTAAAEISSQEVSPARGPNGMEQVARRYSLQDYSVTEYSVVGSPVTRAIRVLRPGADKPFSRETSREAASRAFVEAPNQHSSIRDSTAIVQAIPSEYATSPAVSSSRHERDVFTRPMTDISKKAQGVEFVAESNKLDATRHHTPATAQISISSPQSSNVPSYNSLLHQQSEPVTISPAQISDQTEHQTTSYRPTPMDVRVREVEDRQSENEHQDATSITTMFSRNVPREQDTEDDHLISNLSEDTASQRFNKNVAKQLPQLPGNSQKGVDASRSNGDLQKGVCEISDDVDEERISSKLDKATENHMTNVYEGLSDGQTPVAEADTNTATLVDNSQNVEEARDMSAGLGLPAASPSLKSVNNLESNSDILKSSRIVDGGANNNLPEIQASIASVGLNTIAEGEPVEMHIMGDDDLLRSDPTPIVGVTSSLLIEELLDESSTGTDVDGNKGADNSKASEDEIPARPFVGTEMDVSSDLENNDQNGELKEIAANFRAGFREILGKLEGKPLGQESNDEFDIAMEAAIGHNPHKSSVAQASVPLGPVSELGAGTTSDVEGDWLDTYMETEISIMGESPSGNDVSNDGMGDDQDQVELIQGQRTDGDGNVEFLVKWKNFQKAMSWESEKNVLELATNKLLEFFKRIVLEKIGPEVIEKPKRRPGRPLGSLKNPKGQKFPLSRAKIQPNATKITGGRPRGSQNHSSRQKALMTIPLTKGRAETSELLLSPAEQRGRESLHLDQSKKNLASTYESSLDTSLLAREAVEGSVSLPESSAKRTTALPRRIVRSKTDDNTPAATASESVRETPATLSELPVKRGPGRPRKTPLLTTQVHPKVTRVIRPPRTTKTSSKVGSTEKISYSQGGSQNSPIRLDSSPPTPSPESSVEATPSLPEISPKRHRGRQNAHPSHENGNDSSATTRVEIPQISRSVHFVKRGRGRQRGSTSKARRRAAEPTLITRIKTMARGNRGKPAIRHPGEVFLPWMSRRGQANATSSEVPEKPQPLQRRVSRATAPENADPVAPEPQSEQFGAEESEEESESAESQPAVSERPKRKSKGRIVKNIRRGVQKRTGRGRIAQPTIATRMKTMGRSNRGQPPSRLPGHIAMPWTPRRRRSRAKPLEAPEAETIPEVESEQPGPGEPDHVITGGRPKRETRNLMPKYEDAMRFDDLEGQGPATVPITLKRQRRSSHTGLLAANDEEPQSRTSSGPAEADSKGKRARGRRSGSGYVKDRWYYAPY